MAFELLLESPLSGEGGSFVDACRLYVLQGGLAQQEWRVPELLHRLLKYLEPKLTQVYKNVRERIGSVLTYIFMIDVSLPNTAPTASPRVPEFTARILEKLKPSWMWMKKFRTMLWKKMELVKKMNEPRALNS